MEKSRMSAYASTKTGTENPPTEKAITRRSTQVPARAAATTPIGTATSTEITSVETVSESVGSTRWPIRCVTGRLVKIEMPRSPWSNRHSHWPKRCRKGSSRPRFWRMRAMSSLVAASPARIAAGSPGVRYSRRKTTKATTAMTTMVANRRRTTYANTVPVGLAGLLLFHVPQQVDRGDDEPADVGAVRGRQDELAGRDDRHEFEGPFLHSLGRRLGFRRRLRVEPRLAQLFHLRVGRPAEPCLLAV